MMKLKNWIRLICAVLCALVLATAMAGCAKTGTGGDTTEGSAAGATTGNSEPAEILYADIVIRDYGTVTVRLEPAYAPVTVANFVDLAESGFYDGLTFHRIIKGFMMQGGDPKGDGTGNSGSNIVGEFAANGYNNKLSHTRGVISMARAKPMDSASCQFFIVHQDYPSLDGKYAAFGYVTEGMEVVDAICEAAVPIDDNGLIAADAQPVIVSVTIRREPMK